MGTDDRSHDPPRRGTKTLSVHVSLNAVLRLVNTLLWAVLCFVAVREAMWLSPPSVTPSTSSMFSYTGVDTTSAHVPNSDGRAEHPHDTDHPDHLPMHGVYSPHAMYAAAAQYHHYCSAGLVLVAGYLDVLPPFLNLGLLLLVGLLMGVALLYAPQAYLISWFNHWCGAPAHRSGWPSVLGMEASGGCDALFTALVRVRDLNRYLRWEALVALLRQLCMYVAQGACLRLGYGLELSGSRAETGAGAHAGVGAGAGSKQSSTQSRYISRLGGRI